MAIRGKQGYIPKQRNSNRRKRKSVIVISAEGRNKTETLYLKNFNSENVRIHFATGGATDPVNMVKELIHECEEQEIDGELGDRAYCIIDSDLKADKDQKIKEADQEAKKYSKYNMEVIVSNPCFEVWFLCHFGYSTKQYQSNDEVLKDLECKISGYSKNRSDIYELLCSHQSTAIKNAKKLERFNLEDGRKMHTAEFQPSTEVYKIVESIKD